MSSQRGRPRKPRAQRYTPPSGAMELSAKRTAFLMLPHVYETITLPTMLQSAYLQGVNDCAQVMLDQPPRKTICPSCGYNEPEKTS